MSDAVCRSLRTERAPDESDGNPLSHRIELAARIHRPAQTASADLDRRGRRWSNMLSPSHLKIRDDSGYHQQDGDSERECGP